MRASAAQPIHEILCEECRTAFEPKNALARYCTSACRQRAWRRARPGYASAATKRWLETSPSRREKRDAYMQEYRQRPAAIALRQAAQQARHRENPDPARNRARAHYEHITRFLTAVKTTCGCVDCGTREGILHFDHRNGTIKEFNPSSGRSMGRVVAEIEKCDVRCASCHAARHERDKRSA